MTWHNLQCSAEIGNLPNNNCRHQTSDTELSDHSGQELAKDTYHGFLGKFCLEAIHALCRLWPRPVSTVPAHPATACAVTAHRRCALQPHAPPRSAAACTMLPHVSAQPPRALCRRSLLARARPRPHAPVAGRQPVPPTRSRHLRQGKFSHFACVNFCFSGEN